MEGGVGGAVRTVLVVEDDPDQQFLIQQELEHVGFCVVVTASLHDALDAVASADPAAFDALVLDLNLPDHRDGKTVEIVQAATDLPCVVYSSTPAADLGWIEWTPTLRSVAKTDRRGSLSTAIAGAIDAAHVREPTTRQPEGATYSGFAEAADHVVRLLATATPLGTWMVTTSAAGDPEVVAVHDTTFGVQVGDRAAGRDSPCSRMARGITAQAVPDTRHSGEYQASPTRSGIAVGAYLGVPILDGSGSSFGSLCGFSPRRLTEPGVLDDAVALVEVQARLLATLLRGEVENRRLEQRLEVAGQAAQSDILTGLGNRRAWDRALRNEEARCRRTDREAGVVIVDLDGLKTVNDRDGHESGDRLIRSAATVIDTTVRDSDMAFRTGGDEFAVLLTDLGGADLTGLVGRLRSALQTAGVSASIGWSVRRAGTDLVETAAAADRRMYGEKAAKKIPDQPTTGDDHRPHDVGQPVTAIG